MKRQEALDHFNRFLDLVDLYEAQAANTIKDSPMLFDLFKLAARQDSEIMHELLWALPSITLDLPLMIRVLYGIYRAYETIMQQTIDEETQRVKEEANACEN